MGQCCSGEKHNEEENVALSEEDLKELVTTTGLGVPELNKYHTDFLKVRNKMLDISSVRLFCSPYIY